MTKNIYYSTVQYTTTLHKCQTSELIIVLIKLIINEVAFKQYFFTKEIFHKQKNKLFPINLVSVVQIDSLFVQMAGIEPLKENHIYI